MNRNKNRFLSVIFACLMGCVVINNTFAANTECTGSLSNGIGTCDSLSEVIHWSGCYWNGNYCKLCSNAPTRFRSRCGSNANSSEHYFNCESVPIGGNNCSGTTYSHIKFKNDSGHYYCGYCEEGLYGSRYAVFNEENGNYQYCHQCPSDEEGVKKCYEDTFECKDNFTKTRVTYPDSLYYNCPKVGYQCECKNDGDHYVGFYPGYCGSCRDESDGYDRTACSYDTFTCAAHSYKVAYKTRPSGYEWEQAKYGKYECYRCPRVANGTAFGISSSVDPYYMSQNGWTWSTTSRCTASQSSLQSDANGGKYKWENITPDYYLACPSDNTSCSEDQMVQKPCADRTERYQDDNGYWVWPSDVRYSTEELPNRTNMAYEGQECNYTGKKYYYNVPAGYGVINNNTMNATTVACTGNKWNDGTYMSCQSLPAHAFVNEDHTGFICETGYFQSGKTCVRCPMNVDMEISYSDWDYGTTVAPGATSAKMCYVPGRSLGSDDGGAYYAGDVCKYNNSGFWGYYIVCLEYDAVMYGGGRQQCKDALIAFAENVLNVGTGYGQGNSWAEGFLQQAMQTNCAYNKQNGWYQGGTILTDADIVKQLFTHPQYNILDACHGAYVWTF